MATEGNWESWLGTFLAIGGQYLRVARDQEGPVVEVEVQSAL